MIRALFAKILSYFLLGSGPINQTQFSAEQDGSLIPGFSLLTLLNQLANNGAPGPGDFTFTAENNVTAGTTFAANQVINGLVQSNVAGASGVTHTLPTAAQIIAQLPGGTFSPASVIGRSFLFALYNLNTPNGAVTLATATGLTLVGTLVVAVQTVRWFFGQVTSATAVQFSGLGQQVINTQ